MWSLSAAQRAIIIGGCLAAAYTQLTTSPATIEFARTIGADEFHIGILGALPTLMLFCQFLAAVVVNHLNYRRWLWFWSAMVHRLLLLPVAIGPWLWPDVSNHTWVWLLIGTTAANQALLHFSSPLWLSWMGDYLPHSGLSRFWGQRQYWMQWTSAATLFLAAVLRVYSPLDPLTDFTLQIVVGTVLGMADLMFFFKVEEPPVTRVTSPKLTKVFAEPFRHRDFRRFINFTCYWHFAAMVGAPFITLYLLAHLKMDLIHVLILSMLAWVGGACWSQRLGRWSDQYGARPVLVFCVAFKSLNMLALLVTPRDPNIAFWVLAPVFMIDQVLNAGILIANNGFMIKNSPSENRTMYIAASTAVAGMVGGVTSILAGWLMTKMSGWHAEFLGTTWNHFHLLFAGSVLLRWGACIGVLFIREPKSHGTHVIFYELRESMTWRVLAFPVGLYRSFVSEEAEADASATVSVGKVTATRVRAPRWLRTRSRKRVNSAKRSV